MVPLGNQSSAEALRSRYAPIATFGPLFFVEIVGVSRFAPNCPTNFGCLFFGWFSILLHYILHTRNSELNFRSLGEAKQRRSAAFSFADLVWRLLVAFFFVEI